MRIIKRSWYKALVSFLVVGAAYGQSHQPSIDSRIPMAPSMVIINGRPTIYYELHLTNTSKDSLSIKSLDVITSQDSTIVRFDKEELKGRLSLEGVTQKKNSMQPGSTGILYIEANWDRKQSYSTLFHRIEIEMYGTEKKTLIIQGPTLNLKKERPLILGPPLGEGAWAAIYEPSWTSGHRRVMYTSDGKSRIPGRFAIDFMKLDNDGRFAKGDDNLVANWYGHGVDVLAVADGVVSSCNNTFPESKTLSDHPQWPADKATGNYVVINIGTNKTVFYEHLKPMSIKVKPGQKVHRGDVIASLGFTGQTTGPHLHFHVADGISALGAEGIPFAFEAFTLLGSYPEFEKFGSERWTQKDGRNFEILNERPAPNSVIEFKR